MSNPHRGSCCGSHNHLSTSEIYAKIRGAPISEASKKKFLVHFEGKDVALADMRSLIGVCEKNCLNMEFFYDGELSDISDREGFKNIVREKIICAYLDDRRSILSKAIMEKSEDSTAPSSPASSVAKVKRRNPLAALKNRSSEDPVMEPLESGMREAGCMMRFVGVGFRVDMEISTFLGRECFPEYFGGFEEEDNRPMPWWIGSVAVAAGVSLLACVYAWGTILQKAMQ